MAIELRGVRVAYDDAVVIPGVDLRIPEGKVTMLIGPNGCGKSTLLKAVARILPLKGGTVLLDGTDVRGLGQRQLARRLAVLPQAPTVPEGISVADLVAYGRYPYRRPLAGLSAQDRATVAWAMERTGVDALAGRRVDELSGGQRQRVWIALTLAQKASAMMFDEPTTYLDIAHQLEVLELLRRLNREDGSTVVVVIHELNLAAKFADHIVGMKAGQVRFEGAPEQVFTEKNLRELYDIDAQILRDPARGYPVCVDYALAAG
jgi:iron complex transport system ATP-binding protein